MLGRARCRTLAVGRIVRVHEFQRGQLRTVCVLNSLAQGLSVAHRPRVPASRFATQHKDLDRLVSALATFDLKKRLEPADEIRD